MGDSPSSDNGNDTVEVSRDDRMSPGRATAQFGSEIGSLAGGYSESQVQNAINENNARNEPYTNQAVANYAPVPISPPPVVNDSYDDYIASDRRSNRDQSLIDEEENLKSGAYVTGSSISDIGLGKIPQGGMSKFVEGALRYGLPLGIGNLMPTYEERQRDMARDIIGGKGSARFNSDGIISGIDYYNRNDNDDNDNGNDDAAYIRKRMASEVIPEEEATPALSDDLAVNYLQNPNFLYSGQGNLYQPYGYANNTLVDLLRTRNMTQPQQAASNLGLFGNPGDFS